MRERCRTRSGRGWQAESAAAASVHHTVVPTVLVQGSTALKPPQQVQSVSEHSPNEFQS